MARLSGRDAPTAMGSVIPSLLLDKAVALCLHLDSFIIDWG